MRAQVLKPDACPVKIDKCKWIGAAIAPCEIVLEDGGKSFAKVTPRASKALKPNRHSSSRCQHNTRNMRHLWHQWGT
eukprot:6043501-Pleurochrysis_carterae.AAC.1